MLSRMLPMPRTLLGDLGGRISELWHQAAPGEPLSLLLDKALVRASEVAARQPQFLPVELPRAVSASLGLEEGSARAAAAVGLLVWAGADLMDDEADGELAPAWAGATASERRLAAGCLLSALPHLVLERWAGPAGGAILARASALVARALLTMAVGQHRDLMAGQHADRGAYLLCVRQKSGAEAALFAELPACLAGEDAAARAEWRALGEALGVLTQVGNDVHDALLSPAPSRDLLNGIRTEPVWCALELTAGPAAARLRELLELAAGGDVAAAEQARAMMLDAGADLRATLRMVGLAARARRRLDAVAERCLDAGPLDDLMTPWAPLEPARAANRTMTRAENQGATR